MKKSSRIKLPWIIISTKVKVDISTWYISISDVNSFYLIFVSDPSFVNIALLISIKHIIPTIDIFYTIYTLIFFSIFICTYSYHLFVVYLLKSDVVFIFYSTAILISTFRIIYYYDGGGESPQLIISIDWLHLTINRRDITSGCIAYRLVSAFNRTNVFSRLWTDRP